MSLFGPIPLISYCFSFHSTVFLLAFEEAPQVYESKYIINLSTCRMADQKISGLGDCGEVSHVTPEMGSSIDSFIFSHISQVA